MKKLSIAIPVWNNWRFTKNVLLFFQKYNAEFFEIIVVDNGSSDETEVEIRKLSKSMDNLIYIRNDTNLGFAAAVNIAFRESKGRVVLFLNNDIMFSCKNIEWLERLSDSIDDNSFVGPTGGLIDEHFNFVYETKDPSKEINYISGWFLCASRKLLASLCDKDFGPFDDKTFVSYFEDTDLSFRAREIGVRFVICNVPVHHIGKQTSVKIGLSKMYTSSRQKFIKKWNGRWKIK